MAAYTRITEGERTLIYRWIQEGEPQNEIARRLSRNAGSMSREIGRSLRKVGNPRGFGWEEVIRCSKI